MQHVKNRASFIFNQIMTKFTKSAWNSLNTYDFFLSDKDISMYSLYDKNFSHANGWTWLVSANQMSRPGRCFFLSALYNLLHFALIISIAHSLYVHVWLVVLLTCNICIGKSVSNNFSVVRCNCLTIETCLKHYSMNTRNHSITSMHALAQSL